MTYLQYIPGNVNAIILGAKWLTTEWYASKQLVWEIGDAFLMPAMTPGFSNISDSFWKAAVSEKLKM